MLDWVSWPCRLVSLYWMVRASGDSVHIIINYYEIYFTAYCACSIHLQLRLGGVHG